MAQNPKKIKATRKKAVIKKVNQKANKKSVKPMKEKHQSKNAKPAFLCLWPSSQKKKLNQHQKAKKVEKVAKAPKVKAIKPQKEGKKTKPARREMVVKNILRPEEIVLSNPAASKSQHMEPMRPIWTTLS